jgi:hypothetical protein
MLKTISSDYLLLILLGLVPTTPHQIPIGMAIATMPKSGGRSPRRSVLFHRGQHLTEQGTEIAPADPHPRLTPSPTSAPNLQSPIPIPYSPTLPHPYSTLTPTSIPTTVIITGILHEYEQ